jgi:hypothetical protein
MPLRSRLTRPAILVNVSIGNLTKKVDLAFLDLIGSATTPKTILDQPLALTSIGARTKRILYILVAPLAGKETASLPSKNKVTPSTRRRTLIRLAGLAASASTAKMARSADPESVAPRGGLMIKRASLLARKPGMSHEEVHAPMARACPGISRYTLTIVKSSSTRKDVAPFEIQVDGIAELWFKNQAAFDLYQNSPATKRLRDDGATFIGREIDFVTEEKVVIS